ncbi:hypothetical protein C0J52_22861 [Blattella germanica]|nr:hypothetical protein C0J52_22861 [Blattella germanica]
MVLRLVSGEHSVYIKYSHNQNEKPVRVSLQKYRGRFTKLVDCQLVSKYPNGRQIKAAKFKDLQSLMQFVPPIYSHFYQSLTSDASGDPLELENIDDEFDSGVCSMSGKCLATNVTLFVAIHRFLALFIQLADSASSQVIFPFCRGSVRTKDTINQVVIVCVLYVENVVTGIMSHHAAKENIVFNKEKSKSLISPRLASGSSNFPTTFPHSPTLRNVTQLEGGMVIL